MKIKLIKGYADPALVIEEKRLNLDEEGFFKDHFELNSLPPDHYYL